MQFFKNNHNLIFKSKSCLIFPMLAKLCILHQIINTYNSKELTSTNRSVRSARSDRNAYREKLEYVCNNQAKMKVEEKS